MLVHTAFFHSLTRSRMRPLTVNRDRFWHKPTFEALESIKALSRKHETTPVSASLRWLRHHSCLDGTFAPSLGIMTRSICGNDHGCRGSTPLFSLFPALGCVCDTVLGMYHLESIFSFGHLVKCSRFWDFFFVRSGTCVFSR